MAGNAVIGSLRVNLGLDSAEFSAGLKRAQTGLGRFGKAASVAFAAVGTAGIAAAAGLTVAIKGAADRADNFGKLAQKVGATVEGLSRLEHAAALSDVSLDELGTGLRKLSENMVAARSKGTPAATAFQALGVSVVDSAGHMRNSEAVFADVADALSRMEGSATKTTLAQRLFGKAGSDLLPMLNLGKKGLKEMADESDRLGLTVSTRAAAAAESFNDALTNLERTGQGVANRIMEGVVPGLEDLTDTLADPRFAQAAESFANTALAALNAIAGGAANAVNNLRMIGDWFASGRGDLGAMSTEGLEGKLRELGLKKRDLDNLRVATEGRLARGDDMFGINRGALQSQLAGIPAQMQALIDEEKTILALLDQRQNELQLQTYTPPGAPPLPPPPGLPTTLNANPLKDGMQTLADEMESLRIDFERQNPFKALQMDLDHLGAMLNASPENFETFSKAAWAARLEAGSALAEMASTVSGTLAGIFKDNKAFALADIGISTAQGIMKALAVQGPLGWIQAAAIGAAGVAQAASVMSATPGSSSLTAPAAAPAVPAPDGSGSSRTVYVEFRGGGRTASRDEVAALMEQMVDLQKDGYRLVFNGGK